MADLEITHIAKQSHANLLEGITHLGGEAWKSTRQEVVELIEAETNTYFTMLRGHRSNLRIVHGLASDYVRTHADGIWNDNLLDLPDLA